MDGGLEKKLRAYLGKYLRRLYSRSPLKTAVYSARLTNGGWLCYLCGGFSRLKKDFHVEHVSPVVPPEASYIDSVEYFTRMFCLTESGVDIDNLQLSCKGCHAVKTAEEDGIRFQNGTGRFSAAAREKAALTRAKRSPRRKRRRARKA
jgi:hypothetical protein